MNTWHIASTVAIVSLTASIGAYSQSFTGSIRGEVRDADGPIPASTVTLTNEETSVSRNTVTNAVGQYTFPAVPPGTYSLTTTFAGYKTGEHRGINVGTQEFLTIDLTLEPGAVQETVVVTSDPFTIQTATASMSSPLDRQQLDRLPAPGRNAFLIGVTVPSVLAVGDPQFNRQQDQSEASRVSIGGGPVRAHDYLMDGVSIADLSGRAVLNPTIEALEQVRVQVRTYDAEAARTGGGVFNVAARSGTNSYRGTGFIQTRPVWGQSENFFNRVAGLTKEETRLSDAYYRLYGGGFGGPIKRNRTFFWTATEGYRSATTRNMQEVWPSLKQRDGDFSTTTRGGRPVELFNSWCRSGVANVRCPATGTGSIASNGYFTDGRIPLSHPAVSPLAVQILREWPTHTINGPIAANEDGEPNAIGTAYLLDQAFMWTVKVDHKIRNNWSLSGLYIYNRTDEPGSSLMSRDKWYMADRREFFEPLRRRPHVVVANTVAVLNSTTTLSLRSGWTTWEDSYAKQPFEPGLQSLGFSPAFVSALGPGGADTFPSIDFDEVTSVGGWGGLPTRWGSSTVAGTLSKLAGTHSVKLGADVRHLDVSTATQSRPSGAFQFNRLFTSNAGVGGHDLASFLLGLPASGFVPANLGEGNWFTRYYGAFVQDDWRMSPSLTVTYGIRLEHEPGLRERDKRQTVGFDRDAVNLIDTLVPKAGTLLADRTLRGGLIYAGVNGAPEHQGDPPMLTAAPRLGATYALSAKTILRGGYGTFSAPWQYDIYHRAQTGFTRITQLAQSSGERDVPLTILDNPFPAGIQQPHGSALGLRAGVGGAIEFVDQTKGTPKVYQYSAEVQRELRGQLAVTIGYLGATGRDIGFGGSEAAININQVDPAIGRQAFPAPGGGWDAAALREPVANPFFGIAEAGELGARELIPRGQLLRPFPHFGDILMLETTTGSRRQYHAAVFTLERRLSRGWGGRFSYTWSRTRDNQFGESSAYQSRVALPQNNYNLEAEYGVSNIDVPHRVVLAPMVSFPGGDARNGLVRALIGGWNAAAIVEFASGSPLNAVLSEGESELNLALLGGRQRPNLVGDPNTPGSDRERVSSAEHPDARWFHDRAFANPGPGAFGNAPRTLGNARYQFRKNVDVVLAKSMPFPGGQLGEARFEILNLTNTPKFRGIDSNAFDLPGFGRITAQAGFMRIWQLSFRYRF